MTKRVFSVIILDFLGGGGVNFYIGGGGGKILYRPFCYCYLVDPGSSHTLVLKIKPYISKCFVFLKFDCGQLIITVIELLRILYR